MIRLQTRFSDTSHKMLNDWKTFTCLTYLMSSSRCNFIFCCIKFRLKIFLLGIMIRVLKCVIVIWYEAILIFVDMSYHELTEVKVMVEVNDFQDFWRLSHWILRDNVKLIWNCWIAYNQVNLRRTAVKKFFWNFNKLF